MADERQQADRAERDQAGLLAAARADIRRLEAEKEASDDKVFGLAHEVRALRGRERDLQEIVAGRREHTARLEARGEALLARVSELEAQLAERDRRAGELRRQIEEGDRRAGELSRQIEERDQRAGELQRQVEQENRRAAEMRRQIETGEPSGELRRQVAERDELVGELRRQVEEAEAKRQATIAARKGAAAAAEKLRAELEEVEDSREKLSRELQARDRDLDRTRSELQRSRADQAALTKRMRELQASKSYRVMRRLWRINAAVRRPFSRSRRAPEVEAPTPAEPERPTLPAEVPAKAQAPEPASAPGATPAPAAPAPSPAAVEVDPERRRWLADAAPARSPDELRVAAVLDEMSTACFEPECDLVTFGSDDWRETVEERRPHLLLVESTWQGNSGSWQYQVASYTHPDYAGLPNLRALTDWCREREIPTVFWNKEDPVHFDRFSEAAALFDHVLTTDSNCLRRYEALDGRATTIEALPFAAQPLIHNPIALSGDRSSSPCFAGAYYRDRHADRRRSLEMLLDAARPYDLVIYDRRFGSEDKAFGFPERFRPHVKGRLSYEEMLTAYKSHKLFLNVNSVADSPTMFSRRVFELAACDTAVLSTESVGIASIFGELVPIVETPEQATEALERLLGDEDHRRELVRAARRLVLSEHTYRRRLATIAATAGYEVSADAGEELAVLVLVDGVEQARGIRSLVTAITEQTVLPAEFMIGFGARTSVAGDLQRLSEASDELRVRVTQQDANKSRMERFRELAAIASSPWLAIVHTGHQYGEHHLGDLLSCTRFTDADVIGASSFETTSGEIVNPRLEHRFGDLLHPHSVLVRREVVAKRGWPDEMPASSATLDDWRQEGLRFYGGDRGSFRADAALGVPPRAADLATAARDVDR